MYALQTHYTSSRMGQSGRAGFGFHRISAGSAPDELLQIEQLGGVNLPRDLDPGLSQDELATRAPVMLRFRVLRSGRWALIRARYVGTDYTGRSGNYFAHGLLLDPDTWAGTGLWPVDLAGWRDWQGRLTADDGARAPDLPPADLSACATPPDLTPTALARFLAGLAEGEARLAAMLRAVFGRQASSRAILIREAAGNALPWVACIQKAFPRQLAGALSFCTYQYDSQEAEAINVSVGETNHRFDEADFNYRWFAFDEINGRASTVPDAGAEYAAALAGWLVGEPAQLGAFHAFMDQFDLPDLDAHALTQGLRLFRLDQGANALPGGTALLDLLGFAQAHARPAVRGRLLALLADGLTAEAPHLDAGAWAAVIAFLATGAGETGLAADQARALAAWFGMFDAQVLGRGAGLPETLAARDDLLQRLPGLRTELAAAFVAPARLEALYPRLRTAAPALVVSLVTEVLGQLAVADPASPWPDTPVAPVLAGLASAAVDPAPLLDHLLGAVAGDPKALVSACRLLAGEVTADGGDTAARLEALGRALGRLPAPVMRTLRPALDAPADHPLLRGDWLERVAGATDPDRLYADYTRDDLPLTPRFAQAAHAFLRGHWWQALPEAAALKQARDWLQSGELAALDDALVVDAAARLNAGLPLQKPNAAQQQVARALGALVADRGLRLAPNHPLLYATRAALKAGDADRVALAQALAGQLGGLPPTFYRKLLANRLLAALEHCDSPDCHGAVLAGLYAADQPAIFAAGYRDALERISDPGLVEACRWWLRGDDRVPRSLLHGALAECLCAMKPAARERLNQEIGKGLTKTERGAWAALIASAERPPGLFKRLFGR